MATFPAFVPTRRAFTPGKYPVKAYRALSGASVRRSFGNKPSGHTLELEYQNVPQAVLTEIVSHYVAQGGETTGFAIPSTLFKGYNTGTLGLIMSPEGAEWFYSEPPSIQSVIKDYSNISLRLVTDIVVR